MRKIITGERTIPVVQLEGISTSNPVFAKKDGELCGMIVLEKKGWVLRLGGGRGADGFHDSLEKCIKSAWLRSYEFFVE